jgi:type IV pilus assembly protein PilQ
MTELNQRRLASALFLPLILPLITVSVLTGCTAFNTQNDGTAANDPEMDFENAPKTTPSVATDEGGGAMTNQTTISDLRYVSRKGGGTVVIESSSPLTFRTRENREQNQFVVDIANAQLPDRLKRPYITKDFGQSISSVNAYQDSGSNTAHVVITFRAPTRATATQSGKKLMVFATGPAAPLANGKERSMDDTEEIDTLAKTAAIEGGPSDSRILPSSSELGDSNRFYGRPISIEVRDTSVRDVIQLISEQSGANIVLASGIDGNISLKLKQIPWDQALLIVMKSQSLGYVRQGSVLRIAPLDRLKAENDASKAIIDAQVAAQPLKVKIVPVSYAQVAELVARITPFLTVNRGKIVADGRTSSLIITDTPEIIDRITNLIKALDTPPLQVLIEGKVVEASEGFTRNYGVSWGVNGQPIGFGGAGAGIQNNALTIAPTGGAPAGGLAYNIRLGTFDILGDLDATLGLAESENNAKILSSPRLTTMNNKKATITQGSNIFVPTSTTGAAGVTTSFQVVKVELALDVTPQVTTDGDVIMDLHIKRDFVGNVQAGSAQPPVETREVTTNIMVRNGQTAVVGGVYQSDATESEAGVPVLKNIPVIGWLFKTKSTVKNKNELLVFLTPRIINSENGSPKEGTIQ